MQTFDVPDTIPLSKVQAFLADLGIGLNDTIQLNIGVGGVYVELWASDGNGQRYIEHGSTAAATHRIAIKLDRDA